MLNDPGPSDAPPGMITIEECDRKIEAERLKWEASKHKSDQPKLGKGEMEYQARLDDMYEDYKRKEELGEDQEEEEEEMDISEAIDILSEFPKFDKDIEKYESLQDELDDLIGKFESAYETAERTEKTKDMAIVNKLEDERDKKSNAIERLEVALIRKAEQMEAKKKKALNPIKSPSSKSPPKPSWTGRLPPPAPPTKKAKSPPKPKKKEGCNMNTTKGSCESDPIGCRFSEKTEKRAAYCAKRSPPKSKKSSSLPIAAVHPFDKSSMGHLPVMSAISIPTADVHRFDKSTMSNLPAASAIPVDAPVPVGMLAPVGAEPKPGFGGGRITYRTPKKRRSRRSRRSRR